MYFQPHMQQNILTYLQIIIIHYCTCAFLTWRFQNSLQILISTCTRGTSCTQTRFPDRFSQDTGLEGTGVGWDWKIYNWIPEAGGVTGCCSRNSLSLSGAGGRCTQAQQCNFPWAAFCQAKFTFSCGANLRWNWLWIFCQNDFSMEKYK